jgi:hypothetical protein
MIIRCGTLEKEPITISLSVDMADHQFTVDRHELFASHDHWPVPSMMEVPSINRKNQRVYTSTEMSQSNSTTCN